MEPEFHDRKRVDQPSEAGNSPVPPAPDLYPRYRSDLDWLLNRQGSLRAGWVIAIFILLYRLFVLIFGTVAVTLYPALVKFDYSPSTALASELVPFFAMLAAAGLLSAVLHWAQVVAVLGLLDPQFGQNTKVPPLGSRPAPSELTTKPPDKFWPGSAKSAQGRASRARPRLRRHRQAALQPLHRAYL